jgi:hypothetical protein
MFKLYNGCPNSELQAHWDSEDEAEKIIKDLGYLVTFFPVESGYHLCKAETYITVGDIFSSKQQAVFWLKNNYKDLKNENEKDT